MLNEIKNMLKQQSAYQEAADLLLEDSMDLDAIILGQEDTYMTEEDEFDMDDTSDIEEDVDEEPVDPEENDAPNDDIPDTDLGDAPIDDDNDMGDIPVQDNDADSSTDMGNEPIEDESLSTDEPVMGTNEPTPSIADEDIVDTVLDLRSNTPKDTLPTPPAGAASAISDAEDTQRVDSGFGANSGDTGEPIADVGLEPVDQPETTDTPPSPVSSNIGDEEVGTDEDEQAGAGSGEKVDPDSLDDGNTPEPETPPAPETPVQESYIFIEGKKIKLSGNLLKQLTEAITLDGNANEPITAAGAQNNSGDTSADAMPDENAGDDTTAPDTSTEDEASGQENAVTAAVRDKVNETEDDMDTSDLGDMSMDDDMDMGGSTPSNKEFADKLLKLQKANTDMQNLVIKKILADQGE